MQMFLSSFFEFCKKMYFLVNLTKKNLLDLSVWARQTAIVRGLGVGWNAGVKKETKRPHKNFGAAGGT